MLPVRRVVGRRPSDRDGSTVGMALDIVAVGVVDVTWTPVMARRMQPVVDVLVSVGSRGLTRVRSVRSTRGLSRFGCGVVAVVNTRTRAPGIHGTPEEEQDSSRECGTPQPGASVQCDDHLSGRPVLPNRMEQPTQAPALNPSL